MSSSDYQSEYAGIRENVIIAVLYYMCTITVFFF